jgi:hypothetical protein
MGKHVHRHVWVGEVHRVWKYCTGTLYIQRVYEVAGKDGRVIGIYMCIEMYRREEKEVNKTRNIQYVTHSLKWNQETVFRAVTNFFTLLLPYVELVPRLRSLKSRPWWRFLPSPTRCTSLIHPFNLHLYPCYLYHPSSAVGHVANALPTPQSCPNLPIFAVHVTSNFLLRRNCIRGCEN